MYTYSAHSIAQRATLHPILQAACDDVLDQHDYRIEIGARTPERQMDAFKGGTSKDDPSDGKYPHMTRPDGTCWAMDVTPYVDGKQLNAALFGKDIWETCAWVYFCGMMMYALDEHCRRHNARNGTLFKPRWGGNWSRDARILDKSDRRFVDAFHFEIEERP